ncbi:MAG: cob(I)yrinic acid a,c-diamide adenosyltransferase [Verrucomicrobiota bacterium JB022]|nr:cob(I)yrinic acid a,c-diamide adenosyltransferase [Verrucomicrobiota bacterium JB022]
MERGYVQIYTGNGKGKTTACLGLTLRACGRGMRVYIGQFMKGQDYGELKSVQYLPGVKLEQYGDPGWCRKGKQTDEQRALAQAGYAKGRAALTSGEYDLVILDEINMAVWFELLSVEQQLELFDVKPLGTELVMSGRNVDPVVIERADLVTEMREVKHYYQQKVPARVGIEM